MEESILYVSNTTHNRRILDIFIVEKEILFNCLLYFALTIRDNMIIKCEPIFIRNLPLMSNDIYDNICNILIEKKIKCAVEFQEKFIRLVMDGKISWDFVEQYVDTKILEKHITETALHKLNF